MTLRNVADLPHEGDPRYIDPRLPLFLRALLRALHAVEDTANASIAVTGFATRYVNGPRALLRGAGMRIEPARTVTADDGHRIDPPVHKALTAMEAAVAAEGFGAPHRISHGNPPVLQSVGRCSSTPARATSRRSSASRRAAPRRRRSPRTSPSPPSSPTAIRC